MKYFSKIKGIISRIIITLKFSILSIFITLFAAASIVLMMISYNSSSKDIMFTANKSMHDITQSLHQVFIAEMNMAQRDVMVTTSLINAKVLDVKNVKSMIDYFFSLAWQFNIVQAIYWGDVKGNYISAEYKDDDSIISHYDNASANPPTEMTIDRDVKGNITSTKTMNTDYDPRTRPWFNTASQSGKPSWTDVYLYEQEKFLGITFAVPVYEADKKLKGVLGADVRLDWISWYIAGLTVTPHGILFIVQNDGKLLGYPNYEKMKNQMDLLDIHTLSEKWVADSFDLYQKNKKKSFSFKYNNQVYLATYHPISMLSHQGWMIGLVIPESDFIGQLIETRMLNMWISLFILLTGILIVSYVVNGIVKPVKSLIVETNKIKDFDLEGEGKVVSHIKEIIQLSDAITTMKNGLKAFKRYVPSELVRQLIRKGENTALGGSHKMMVAFFSDIKDFTTISHHADPDQLISQLNEYFEELTRIILNEQGTIDKYIGDAIMAFWGAPQEIANPCLHAAEAALQFTEHLSVLNKKWVNEGKPEFYTRIGINYGEAIVGNIGSSERINYTAIGDSVNIASRLEGANKELNTMIVVSESVYQKINNEFNCRDVGSVTLKGIAEKVKVYELLGRKIKTRRIDSIKRWETVTE